VGAGKSANDIPLLVERASRYQDAVRAVFEQAKTLDHVGALEIEAMPVLAYILVLANRSGLTDGQIRGRIPNNDDLRAFAEQGTRGADMEEQMAGWWILRWLDEPLLAEMAHKNLVLDAGLGLLVAQPTVTRGPEAPGDGHLVVPGR
jgi:hypothetical protein